MQAYLIVVVYMDERNNVVNNIHLGVHRDLSEGMDVVRKQHPGGTYREVSASSHHLASADLLALYYGTVTR